MQEQKVVNVQQRKAYEQAERNAREASSRAAAALKEDLDRVAAEHEASKKVSLSHSLFSVAFRSITADAVLQHCDACMPGFSALHKLPTTKLPVTSGARYCCLTLYCCTNWDDLPAGSGRFGSAA